MGIGASYVWHRHEAALRNRLTAQPLFARALSLSAVALLLGIALLPAFDFSSPDTWRPGGFMNALYLTFSRTLWAIGIAVFSFGCFVEPAGPVASFLGAKAFAPLARLTYGAYITHPIIIKMLAGGADTLYHCESPRP